MPDPHGTEHLPHAPVTWGSYNAAQAHRARFARQDPGDWQRRMLAAIHEPWLLPDDRAWPPRARIDAWVAPRWTETARRTRVARARLGDAWLSLGAAAIATRTAVRVMATGRTR